MGQYQLVEIGKKRICNLRLNVFRKKSNNCTLNKDLYGKVNAFNPVEEETLLIKKARNKTLEDEMKLSTSDLIKFVLIYNTIFHPFYVTGLFLRLPRTLGNL